MNIFRATRQGLSCFRIQWKVTVVASTEPMEQKKVNATLWQVFNLIKGVWSEELMCQDSLL